MSDAEVACRHSYEVNAPPTFEQAVERFYAVLGQRRWPQSVAWLTPADLRIRNSHVILRAHKRPEGLRVADATYASALRARTDIRICVPGRTLGLVFSFVVAGRSSAQGPSQLQIQFWDFDIRGADAVTHRSIHWRLRDAALDLDSVQTLKTLKESTT